jgi:hypothetical protein
MSPEDEEALFAAIGLLPILRAKPTVHKYQFEAAAAAPKTIRKRMAAFLGADEFAEAKDLPDFDYDEVSKLVSSGQTPEQTAAMMKALSEPEIASDLLVKADRLQTWAKGILPRPEQSGFMNLHVEDIPESELADFRRVWAVACDPMTILDDLEDGSLSEDQVAAMQLLYPATYAEMSQSVVDAGAQLAARRGKDWQPSPTKLALLGILRGQATVDVSIAADVQAMFAQQEAREQAALQAQQRGGGGGAPATSAGESTPGQEAAAG